MSDSTGMFAKPKYYVTSFPKSGTHLIGLMVQPIARPMSPNAHTKRPWVGSFKDHSFSGEWHPTHVITYRLSMLQPGRFFLGHCGHLPEIEQFLWLSGTAMVFVYRDLRAVAISHTHHVLSDEDRFCHSSKDLYQEMGSFEDALVAVIEGVEGYPGLIKRWEAYAPWLDVKWTLRMRYEDVMADRKGAARVILEYGIRRVAAIFGRGVKMNEETTEIIVEDMVRCSRMTHRSPTFREGSTDGWREEWTDRADEAFRSAGGYEWIERLGYEPGGDDDPTTPRKAAVGELNPEETTVGMAG